MEKKTVNHEMIVLARESRGLTQAQVATKIGVTQVTISKVEKGLGQVSDVLLGGLIRHLDYPADFFYTPGYRYPPATPFHRKKMSLPKKIQYQLEAQANLRRLHVTQLFDAVEHISVPIPYLDIDDYGGSPAEVARAVRGYLRLPRGPIKNITKILEDQKIIVLRCNFGTTLIDGFTLIAEGKQPIIFVNRELLGDRLRFTLTHEYGHIVMHTVPHPRMEEEANVFAGEFLMPAEEIRASLRNITLQSLANLKPYWKVSMAALLYRAKDLQTITPNQFRHLWAMMGVHGYAKREPSRLDVAVEEPTVFNEMVQLHIDDLSYTEAELCSMLAIHSKDFRELYPGMEFGGRRGLRSIK